jgi:uncharacterized protein
MIKRLEAALRKNPSLSEILQRFNEIELREGWLVAGAVAQTVWNLSGEYPAERGIKDADIVYFDAADLSAETEAAHEARIRALFAHLPVKLDVKNEARVHLWYEKVFGYSIPLYISVESAIASFPTTATAIGVRQRDAAFECRAPFGLEDLFSLVVRPNRMQISEPVYEAKVVRWRSLWPHLTFIAWNDSGPAPVTPELAADRATARTKE